MTPPIPLRSDRWLKTTAAATYVGFGSRQGFTAWAAAAGVVACRRGRVDLWDRIDLDRAMEQLKGHAPTVRQHVA